MYSMVVLMALSGSATAPAWHGGHGDCSAGQLFRRSDGVPRPNGPAIRRARAQPMRLVTSASYDSPVTSAPSTSP